MTKSRAARGGYGLRVTVAPPSMPVPRSLQIAHMSKHKDLISAIGNTPLIRLNRVSALTGCEIWGKAEFLNPGQSVKDRAALFIIHDAVKSGALKPGGTIVEGTAGNTGIGLTLVANSLGFKSVIVIPETQSQEKKDALRLYGAEVIEVPAKPYKNPNNYIKISGRLAEKLNRELPGGAVWANQFDNTSNRRAHVETTGPEIWYGLSILRPSRFAVMRPWPIPSVIELPDDLSSPLA